MSDEQLEAALSATAKSLRREKAVLDLINYGEWLDCQHLMCSLVDDERTHEELARDYLAQR